MNKDAIVMGVIGLLVGVLLAGASAGWAVNNDHQGMMRMMGMRTQGMMDEGGGMDDTSALGGKTGDDFDKAFIGAMIDHHEGAITMARLAKTSAKHNEIKQMADDIISAQSREIDLLESWRLDWGYKDVPASHGNEMMH